MPAVTRKGDQCSGHNCHPPRVNDEGSSNVLVNNIQVHRQGDHWVTHCCGDSCHDGVCAVGSSTVYVNNKQVARIGDPITCGSIIAQGSPDTFIG